MFKKGEMVVYPNHGVGVVTEIQDHEIDGRPWNCYCLRIESSEASVMVPTEKADVVGLRRVIDKKEVERVFGVLKSTEFKLQPNWKGRFKENSERMRTGSIFEVAEVLKNLSYLSSVKALSYREKRMYEKARQLIVSELALVRRISEHKVEQQIDRVLGTPTTEKTSH